LTQHGSFPGRPRGRRARQESDVPEWQGYDATPQDQREFPDLAPIRPREARTRDGRGQGGQQGQAAQPGGYGGYPPDPNDPDYGKGRKLQYDLDGPMNGTLGVGWIPNGKLKVAADVMYMSLAVSFTLVAADDRADFVEWAAYRAARAPTCYQSASCFLSSLRRASRIWALPTCSEGTFHCATMSSPHLNQPKNDKNE